MELELFPINGKHEGYEIDENSIFSIQLGIGFALFCPLDPETGNIMSKATVTTESVQKIFDYYKINRNDSKFINAVDYYFNFDTISNYHSQKIYLIKKYGSKIAFI